jgi:PEP-CTERM motif
MKDFRIYIAIALATFAIPIAVSANTITINFTGGTAAVSGSAITTTSPASWISYEFVTPMTDSGLLTPTSASSFGPLSFTTGAFTVASTMSASFAAGGTINLNSTDLIDLGLSAPEDGTFTGSFTGVGTGMQTTLCNGNPSAGNNYQFSQAVSGSLDEGLVAAEVFTPVIGTFSVFSCGNTGTPSLGSAFPITEGTLFLTDQVPTVTPEPGTLGLFGSGLLGVGFWIRRSLMVRRSANS